MRYEVCVVGAGPAGLAAAATAARGGASVALVDAAPRLGGQFWRHPASGITPDLYHDVPLFERLQVPHPRVTHLPGHHVWTIERDVGTFVVRAVQGDTEVAMTAACLILAPGAYDRQIPFPGWDVPGVMTAGGAQALLKGGGVLAGKRVLVGGTGPFLLPVAAGLAERGATVVGVCEANNPTGWIRHPAIARQGAKLREAAAYGRTLLRHRVPIHHRTVISAAHGDDRVTAATMTRGSRSRRLEVDAVAVGWGFTPQLELHLALGCETRVDADGSLVVVVDSGQLTSRPGVLAAGESTGVGGASLAVVEGAIAGSTAAALTGHRDLPERTLARLRRRRASLTGFARAMHAVYPVPTGWADRLTGDTLVCRCEEVTVAQLRHAVELGAVDVRTAKLLSRAGMGRCQGRVCGYAAACLTAEWTGGTYDPRGVAERPVASPLPLGLVAEGPDEDQTS